MLIYFYNMAKTYRRRYRRNVNKLMRNYFKARLDTVQKLVWNTDGIKFVTDGEATNRDVKTLLELCNDWDAWRLVFHTFKITGMAVEVNPGVPSASANQVPAYGGMAVLSLLTTRDNSNWNSATESNFSFSLATVQRQRKYKSFNGGINAWMGTDDLQDIDGKFTVQSDGNPTNAAIVYMVKFSFYVTFKNPN